MKFTTNSIQTMNGILMLGISPNTQNDVQRIIEYVNSGKKITVEIKRELRSKDANGLCWVLCQKLAEKLTWDAQGKVVYEKEDIYRKAIKECGFCTIVPIKSEAVKSYKRIWAGHGTGWIVEELGPSKLKGYVNLAAYHGSSVYDSKEMSRLIDVLMQDCKEQGIETEPPEYVQSLLEQWGENEE